MKKLYAQEVINYIEENITDVHTVDSIANHIGYSKYYLNKIFYIFTGLTIMYYVKKRKIEHSIIDLKTDMDVVDIAFKYGFNSRRAYSRFFKSYYGDSPSKYRGNNLVLTPKLNVSDELSTYDLPYLSESYVKHIDTLFILSRRIISNNPEEEVIGLQHLFKQKNNLETVLEVGFDIPVSKDQEQKGQRGYEFWLCLDSEDFNKIDSVTPQKQISPESDYLCLTIEDPFSNPFERIPMGWKKLSSIMMDNYVYNNDSITYCMEHVEEIEGKTVMHLYIPITNIT